MSETNPWYDGKGVESWHKETIGKKTVEALIKNDFNACYLPTAEEAVKYIMASVEPGMIVGFPGSMTIYQMGLQDQVKAAGAKVLDHGAPGLTLEERVKIARQEMLSDLYLCSSNAITLDGALINVDAWGNRVGAMAFGPKKVILVVSVDKVCKDEAAAFERLKMMAAPMNNQRLATQNPCMKTGACINCQVKNRICRAYSILRKKPMVSDITVIVLGEQLGF